MMKLNDLLVPEHPFHLAVQVRNIAEARRFYGDQLGFPEGRSAANWIDFDMFGHQLVTHLNPDLGDDGQVVRISNGVDGESVPIPHFGVVLTFDEWDKLRSRVEGFVEEFIISPGVRFAGEVGEQRTMFFCDPTGNALEFKAFANVEEALFAR